VEANYKGRAGPVNLQLGFLMLSTPCTGNAAWTKA
jgi:hypothetical protein